MRNNVYGNYDEKYVKTVIVYAGEENVLFFDEGCKEGVSSADLFDLFLKGLTISYSGGYYAPVSCVTTESETTVNVIQDGETVSVVTFKSKAEEEVTE